MSTETITTFSLLSVASIWLVVKISLLILAGLYFIFSLIIIRQVSLMTDTLITEVSPILRVFAFAHTVLALGIIILMIGFLFG